ncbi:hypothetical protein W03_22250 [Nitrosomonas sp. PY1]|uniref:hypothetical protein n=1 Tax=Nitrosomonas sp. PY1 TaxID=1803906 RepID=UPI001FC7FBA0|nr:hypothetical protein [Nitrosomonas sp. PY1]GKS70221.1 hypothetical protein W03_22250 [Nitrosomonas sp. PY1]
MEATEIIEYLRDRNFTIKTDGDFLELSPPEKITEDLIKRLREHKPAIIAELKREQRRAKVLAILAENPETQRAIIADASIDPSSVILTIAIKNHYTFEMLIPKERYDGFTLLSIIHGLKEANTQH